MPETLVGLVRQRGVLGDYGGEGLTWVRCDPRDYGGKQCGNEEHTWDRSHVVRACPWARLRGADGAGIYAPQRVEESCLSGA